MSLDRIFPWALHLLLPAILALLAVLFWCLFHPDSEGGTLLLCVLGGTLGGCVGAFRPDWTLSRFVSNALSGFLVSLLFYYTARGLALRAAAAPTSVRACAVATLSFFAGLSRSSGSTFSGVNLFGLRASLLLILGYVAQGVVFLCR
jgi:hypothetical protein